MMEQSSVNRGVWWPIFFSLVVGLILTIMPINPSIVYFWPDWLALITVGCCLRAPEKFGAMSALLIGIALDIVLVKKIGVYGFGLVLILIMVSSVQQALNTMSILQQSFVLAVFIALFKLITGWLYGLVSDFQFSVHYWYSLLGDIVFWPFVSIALNKIIPPSRLDN